MTLSKAPKMAKAARAFAFDETEAAAPVDHADAWGRFHEAWPWKPGQESVTAARHAFEKLSAAEQELCAKGAEAFQPTKSWRVSAWAFIAERHWAGVRRRAGKARRR